MAPKVASPAIVGCSSFLSFATRVTLFVVAILTFTEGVSGWTAYGIMGGCALLTIGLTLFFHVKEAKSLETEISWKRIAYQSMIYVLTLLGVTLAAGGVIASTSLGWFFIAPVIVDLMGSCCFGPRISALIEGTPDEIKARSQEHLQPDVAAERFLADATFSDAAKAQLTEPYSGDKIDAFFKVAFLEDESYRKWKEGNSAKSAEFEADAHPLACALKWMEKDLNFQTLFAAFTAKHTSLSLYVYHYSVAKGS